MATQQDLVNAIRVLSMDAVQQAASGHPGMPMGMADIAEVVWRDFLRHNPENPQWPNRDRFMLSNGHGSLLHYVLLHLCGYALPLAEIKRFRQLHSLTPGHPEYGDTPGIETTTGPLGQGIANAVGMAIAERVLAAQFNRGEHCIVDHWTWVFAGDGCLMEGISHEACSLAGTLGLGKLIVIYDDNGISIDGEVSGWFSDDTAARFNAYGWQVIADVEGHDRDSIRLALVSARAERSRPTLIACKTVIGYGAPHKQATAAAHGAPLGSAEVAAVRQRLGWPHPPFEIPQAIYDGFDARPAGRLFEAQWLADFAAYKAAHAELAAEFTRRIEGRLPEQWAADCARLTAATVTKAEAMASRKASHNMLQHFGTALPELIGGSADLAGSNLTLWRGSRALSRSDSDANYIYFGVREFAMVAITSGLALHRGFIPYSATFLVFSDYARNAIRMAALMKLRSVLILTHDSLGLGEDGPTHQPIEHAASLRLIPNLSLWRPCDAVETAIAWRYALERRHGPTALLLSRQALPHQRRDESALANIKHGAYVLCDAQPGLALQAIIIATGSEVALAMQAATELAARNLGIRVVSMPSTDAFAAADARYRETVIPRSVKARVVIEAGATASWHQYAGSDGTVIGIDTFGVSAPAAEAFAHYGFTVENVVKQVTAVIARCKKPFVLGEGLGRV